MDKLKRYYFTQNPASEPWGPVKHEAYCKEADVADLEKRLAEATEFREAIVEVVQSSGFSISVSDIMRIVDDYALQRRTNGIT